MFIKCFIKKSDANARRIFLSKIEKIKFITYFVTGLPEYRGELYISKRILHKSSIPSVSEVFYVTNKYLMGLK